jgi:tetratricopeptide (TPR) repeat protein
MRGPTRARRGSPASPTPFVATALLCFAVAAPSALAAGSSGSSDNIVIDPAGSSSERTAARHHRIGLRERDKAWRFEARAEKASSKEERTRWQAKARKQYHEAEQRQRKAVAAKADFFEAHGSLGYALRKQGDFTGALAAYDRALEIAPQFGEAVEYRAEAYLALGRLRDVKLAYAQLEPLPELAAKLIDAMAAWVAKHSAEPGDIDPAVVEAFGSWVDSQNVGSSARAETRASSTRAGRW